MSPAPPVEGVVCNLLEAADALAGPALDGRLFLVGGAARSAAYRRVVADLTGRVVQVPCDEELVAAGAPRCRLQQSTSDATSTRWPTNGV